MAGWTSTTVGVGEDDLVTGEAVAIDLPPASVGLRIGSGIIDLVLQTLLLYVLLIAAVALSAQLDNALTSGILLTVTISIAVAFPIAFETLTRGKTPGKLAVGLRAVRDDGGPITFRHALARGLVRYVEVFLFNGIVAVVAVVMSKRGKRLGDMVAGTYVVRDRVSASLPPPVGMPPYLASWALSADISALPDELAMAVRGFLPAAAGMEPQARDAMAASLLDELALYVSPPPPSWAHPADILAAVVADRRRRDLLRLDRENALYVRLSTPDPVL